MLSNKSKEIITIVALVIIYLVAVLSYRYQVPVDVDSYYTSKLTLSPNLQPQEFKYGDRGNLKRFTILPMVYGLFGRKTHFTEDLYLHYCFNLLFILLAYFGSKHLFKSYSSRAVFAFLLLSSPYFMIGCRRAEGDTLILVFVGLFFFSITKIWKQPKSLFPTFLMALSVLFSIGIHPMGFALFIVFLLMVGLQFNRFTLAQKSVCILSIILIVCVLYFMNALFPSNLAKELRFLRTVADTKPGFIYYLTKYFSGFTPADYNITNFFRFVGKAPLLILRGIVGWLQAILAFVGLFYLIKQKRYLLPVWFLVPFLAFTAMRLMVDDYFVIALPVFFALLVYGIEYVQKQIDKRILKLMVLVLIGVIVLSNFIISAHILNTSKVFSAIYRERDPKTTWLFPTYSIVIDAVNDQAFLHQIGGVNRFLELLFLSNRKQNEVKSERYIIYSSKSAPPEILTIPKSQGYIVGKQTHKLPAIIKTKRTSLEIISNDTHLLINPVFNYFENYSWNLSVPGAGLNLTLRIKQCALIRVDMLSKKLIKVSLDKPTLLDISTLSEPVEEISTNCIEV